MTSVRVINPGMYTTIQDLGRTGYQQYGMPVSGSMDHFAHRVANLLVGNAQNEAVIEMTIMGGTYAFDEDLFIAITGADMNPKLNGKNQIGMWRSVSVKKGDRVTFGAAKKGCRSYLAVAGGFDLPLVLGSKSTYVRGRFGGLEGRILNKDDLIRVKEKKQDNQNLNGRFIPAGDIPEYEKAVNLRVLLGPQENYFTRKGIADFFSFPYKVSKEFDRMGYRLEGKKVEHESSADIISDGIVKGAVQIPGHGNPIIMLADCQTTGGYTKIAHVINTDLWKVAQLKTGDTIRFEAIDISDAHEIFRKREQKILEMIEGFSHKRLKDDKDFKLNINSQSFEVKINEVSSLK